MVRRIIYVSVAVGNDFLAILRESRVNNGIDGISGLLVFDGKRYTQVLEGPPDSVAAAFERIKADRRHCNLVVLSDTFECERAFSDWTMAGLPGENEAIVRDRARGMLRQVPPLVKQAFAHV